MTQVVELVHAHELEKHERSSASRKKADVETNAALELRDAAMKGIVRRDALTDVAQLDGASFREKQGQRTSKYVHTTDFTKLRPSLIFPRRRHSDTLSDSDKENSTSDAHRKPKRGRNQLAEIVKQRNAADEKRLDKAREIDERRHAETKALHERTLGLQENLAVGLGKLAEGLNVLVQSQANLAAAEANRVEADNRRRIEEAKRRREDAERRATEAERYSSLLQALAGSRNNGYVALFRIPRSYVI